MQASFEYQFPAIRGIQAGREYYTSMCPLRLIPRIFVFDEEGELKPELRAQRTLNKNRIPEMARYVVDNPKGYVFSAITASIDAMVSFEPIGSAVNADENRVGLLKIPMDAKFIINDGQHRRAAIELALKENPEIADETIAVVFFIDNGLERCQQMFADLNRYAIRPSKSLGVLYDHREDKAALARLVAFSCPVFKDIVEMEKSALSPRARKLFTLSSIYYATRELLAGNEEDDLKKRAEIAASYWEEVAKLFPEWKLVREGKMTSGEVRKDFVHPYGITLQALGKVGNALQRNGTQWKQRLKKLKTLDWSRSNASVWEGRAMIGGRVSKAGHNVTLTSNLFKTTLGLPLNPAEQRAEDSFQRGENGKET